MIKMPSKKTLTNELNATGSSYNRRLNTDVAPIVATSWAAEPSETLPSAVSLGSATNPWRNVHTDSLLAFLPRIQQAATINLDGATLPTLTPSNNNGLYWTIDEVAATPANRVVYRWNGSAWVNYNSQLTPGAIFLQAGSTFIRIFIWAGPRQGANFGLRRSFTYANL